MSNSYDLYQRACRHIPGGVNSPVRAFNGVGGTPIFMQRGEGAYLVDVDNKRYIDYIGSWGPLILGHCHPDVISAVQKAVTQGLTFGIPTPIEVDLADFISELMPNLEMVRMVNSGTEATMTAIRLARGITGRDKIIKFEGCYHGHSDSLLVKAGSGALTLGVPSSPGVPASIAEHTLNAAFNDIESVEALFSQYGDQIACVILEPFTGNMNFVRPLPEFHAALRRLCDQHGALLIFDEVMTGFRVALGGAQSISNVKPDITTLGKVIGGGMPVGAIGGSRKIMETLAPVGPVYQAGTLSGNPIAMVAGLVTLKSITEPKFFEKLTHQTQKLVNGLQKIAASKGIPLAVDSEGGMFGFFFTDQPKVTNFQNVMACDIAKFKQFFHLMLEEGIYLAPSAYEAGFVSCMHGDAEIELTLAAAERSFSKLTQ